MLQQILHYDSHTQRQIKNSNLLKPELNGRGLLGIERIKDFGGHPGAETLILNGDYIGFLINTLDLKYVGVLETAVLKQMEIGLEQHSNIVLLGTQSTLETWVNRYGVTVVNIPNGYLQQHHLPQVIEALQSITSKE